MPFFAIYAFDKPGGYPIRMDNYPAHRSYLNEAEKFGVTIIMAGPMVSDDGEKPIGSLIIVEALDRKTAETFHHADPFYKAGVWEKTDVTRFDKKRG